MKGWQKTYRILFVFAISFWILFFPASGFVSNLEEIDAFRKPHWEGPDQEDLLADLGKKGMGFGWMVCLPFLFQRREMLKLMPNFSMALSPIQRPSTIRC
jgi:hypothetical protein